MEVYVMLGLVSLGYMFTKSRSAAQTQEQAQPRAHAAAPGRELPARRRYEAGMTSGDVRSQEMLRAQDLERAARYPMQTGAVDPRARAYTDNPLDSGVGSGSDTVRSELAGVDFAPADFRHNNMQPFFGSHLRGGEVEGGDNGALLERFSGAAGVANSRPKREAAPLFEPSERTEATDVHGNQGFSDALQGRFGDMNMVNRVRNNELPFEQVRVGPGAGQGYTAAPAGGFGQNQDRELVMGRYKDVDELRPGNQPKSNLEGRVNAGAVPGGRLGAIGEASKNRPYTAFDIGDFGMVPTRSSATAASERPDPLHGRALRDPPSAFRVEGAGAGSGGPPVPVEPGQASRVGPPRLQQETPGLTGAGRSGAGPVALEDMHRSHAAPGENERGASLALWSREAAGGGVPAVMRSGPPGAVHVPGRDVRAHFEDGLRLSGREHTSDAPDSHAFGMMSPQAPSRGPAYDPVRHRPGATLKETSIHDARLGNYSNERGQVAGEGSQTRHTVREGMCDTFETFGVRNPGGWAAHAGAGAPGADPRDHAAPTTTRETTTEAVHLGGVSAGGAAAAAPGGYDVAAAGLEEPRLTSRQFTEQTGYYGSGGRPNQTGYGAADAAMRETMTASGGRPDFEYFGIPRRQTEKGVDYAAVYASTLNEAKQALSQGRLPGGHGAGPKRMPTEGAQGEVFARAGPAETGYVSSPGNLPKERGGVGSVAFQGNTGLHHGDRIDEHLLSYLKTNPLVTGPAVGQHTARAGG